MCLPWLRSHGRGVHAVRERHHKPAWPNSGDRRLDPRIQQGCIARWIHREAACPRARAPRHAQYREIAQKVGQPDVRNPSESRETGNRSCENHECGPTRKPASTLENRMSPHQRYLPFRPRFFCPPAEAWIDFG